MFFVGFHCFFSYYYFGGLWLLEGSWGVGGAETPAEMVTPNPWGVLSLSKTKKSLNKAKNKSNKESSTLELS